MGTDQAPLNGPGTEMTWIAPWMVFTVLGVLLALALIVMCVAASKGERP